MYYCKDCKQKFERFVTVSEHHGLDTPPFERIAVCPRCASTDFEEYTVSHCRYCGARLKRRDGVYCNSECRAKGERLWRMEAKRRKEFAKSPLNIIVKQLDEYNRAHGTNFSYGQFVSLVLPRL